MTAIPPTSALTEQQLRAVIHHIARTYLEVERGLRSPDQLRTLLHPDEYLRHRTTTHQVDAAAGPVRAHDLGPVQLTRTTDDYIRATLTVRRPSGWGALLVDLDHTRHGWTVTSLDRLERLVPTRQRRTDPDIDHQRHRQALLDERRAVVAARREIVRRLDDIGDGRRREARQLRDELDRWTRRLQQVDRDIAATHPTVLTEQPDRRHQLAERVLGLRPDDVEPARLWTAAADALDDYRQRWKIAEDGPLLGEPEPHTLQAQQRREIVNLLRQTVKTLAAHREPDGPDPGLRTRGHEDGIEFG